MPAKAQPKPMTGNELLDFQLKVMATGNRMLATGQVTLPQYNQFAILMGTLAEVYMAEEAKRTAK